MNDLWACWRGHICPVWFKWKKTPNINVISIISKMWPFRLINKLLFCWIFCCVAWWVRPCTVRASLALSMNTFQSQAHRLVKEDWPRMRMQQRRLLERESTQQDERKDKDTGVQQAKKQIYWFTSQNSGISARTNHQSLELCLTCHQSLMFDVLHLTSADAPPPGPPVTGQPTCHACQNSRAVPTDAGRKCCCWHYNSYVSMMSHMEGYTLQEWFQYLARWIWNEIQAAVDLLGTRKSNRHFTAYKQFVFWQYLALGQGHRAVIHSVWNICNQIHMHNTTV